MSLGRMSCGSRFNNRILRSGPGVVVGWAFPVRTDEAGVVEVEVDVPVFVSESPFSVHL